MGRIGEQPAGQILPSHGRGTKASARGDRELEPLGFGHGARPSAPKPRRPDHAETSAIAVARAYPGGSTLERDMDDELRFHLESRAADLVRSGLPPAEAARRARLEFGAVEGYKEGCREARGLRPFDELRGDLRYAFRVLRKSPVLRAHGDRSRWRWASAPIPPSSAP